MIISMKKAVLYTGTFDPFHLGHYWQLEQTYRAYPFEKAVIALIRCNPKKPNATKWEQRKKLIELMIGQKQPPFEVEIRSIDYVQPAAIAEFINSHIEGYDVVRTVGSDSVVEFIKDKTFGFLSALKLLNYAVVVRPLVGQDELNQALMTLPLEVAKDFNFKIVHIQTEDDISGTNIRRDPESAFKRGYITKGQKEYILEYSLFSQK